MELLDPVQANAAVVVSSVEWGHRLVEWALAGSKVALLFSAGWTACKCRFDLCMASIAIFLFIYSVAS